MPSKSNEMKERQAVMLDKRPGAAHDRRTKKARETMKVGILQFFGWRDRSVPLNSVYESALERFSVMDTTGYDAVWLAEHHFSSFSQWF